MFARSLRFLGVLPAAPLLGLLACGSAPPQPPPAPPSPVAKPAPSPPPPANPCEVADALRKKVPALLGKGKLDRALRVFARVRELCPSAAPEVLAEDLATSAELAVELYDYSYTYDLTNKLLRMPGASDAMKKRAESAHAAAEKGDKKLENLLAPNITKVTLPLVEQADALAAKGDEASLRAARVAYLGAFAAHPNGQALLGAALVTRRLGDAAEAQKLFDRAFGLLYKTERRLPLVVLPNRDLTVSSLDWSSDGRFLALSQGPAGGDIEVSLFEAETGREYVHLYVPWISGNDPIALSSDAKLLGVKTSSNGFFLDLSSRLLVRELQNLPTVDGTAFSPDLMRLVALQNENSFIHDVSAPYSSRIPIKGGLPYEDEDEPAWPVSATFSPDGKTLAIPFTDDKVRLWEIEKRRVTATLGGKGGPIWQTAFSRDGKTFAVATDKGGVQIWDPRSGALKKTIQVDAEDPAHTIALSPDGSLLAADNLAGISVWDAKTGSVRTKLEEIVYFGDVAFSPDGRRLAVDCSPGPVCVVDATSGALVKRIGLQDPGISSFAISPDGKTLAALPWDGMLRMLDLEKGTLHRTSSVSDDQGNIAFSGDGKLLGGAGHGMRVWNAQTGATVRAEKLKDPAQAFALSPDGSWAAVDMGDAILLFSLTTTNAPARPLLGHTGAIQDLAFSPDGKYLASGSSDKTVRLWDVAAGAEKLRLPGHTDAVTAVVFSPDGKLLASGSEDKSARVWDTATGASRQTFADTKPGTTRSIEDLAFSPDGKLLAVGGLDNPLRLWNVATGEAHLMQNLTSNLFSLAFTPDGQWLVTGWSDGTLHFQSPTGKGPTASIHFLDKEDAAHVLDGAGHVDLLGKNPCAARARLQCRAGRFGMPFDLCEERAFTSGLLATILAGKPAGDDPAHEDVPPRCAP
ncbi:WD40 repeat domain-containing protein [Polyangium jinanense]|uniref:WD40 repeat domain-containing protein n=1 Tax=Polyangium jinanense TaxID=2829994 RepID=A0A9X4AS36_9BACT|nr:WD40 repeat domain-containing protein [Polyangium jinanense]MDC3954402.1 WD40 repeat domain-containing protein [Polyangium jinanense]MDC3980705.1 WD40 repeat domain-containing protein [Polyangium jinanense]